MLKIKRLLTAAIFTALFATSAFAQSQGSVIADFSGSVQAIIGAYSGMVQGSTLTRAANTVAYSANQTICGATTVTACVPGTIPIAAIQQGRLTAKRVTLLKSGANVASTLTLWFYSSAPGTTTPLQLDGIAYSGPRAADVPNYLGNASCSNGTATSDTTPLTFYECTLNPSTNGALILQAQLPSKSVYYLLSTGTAYASPISGETFTPYVGGVY